MNARQWFLTNWPVLLGLTIMFASGLLDAVLLRRKDLAIATWALGLAALTAWILFDFTLIRIFVATLAFLSLSGLMVVYHRRK
jgi:hypothetical protein